MQSAVEENTTPPCGKLLVWASRLFCSFVVRVRVSAARAEKLLIGRFDETDSTGVSDLKLQVLILMYDLASFSADDDRQKPIEIVMTP